MHSFTMHSKMEKVNKGHSWYVRMVDRACPCLGIRNEKGIDFPQSWYQRYHDNTPAWQSTPRVKNTLRFCFLATCTHAVLLVVVIPLLSFSVGLALL